jgi:segregation and condensation protein A
MQRIDARLRRDGRALFTDFFDDAVHKSTLVGMFLAVLELVRHQHARASQRDVFGEIWLEPGDTPLPAELAAVLDYEHSGGEQ